VPCHAVLPGMVARGRGRIVNIVSNSALAPHPFNSAYACSKAALAHLTGSLAAEIAPHGLSAFALSPGSVKTALSQGVTNSAAGREWLQGLTTALGPRWTTADHAARAVTFLATGAGDGLSGRFIHAVDDDIPGLAARAAEVRSADAHRLVLRRLDAPA
jgi:NAD(P)-dependent dehydrogenase (short-subunit alcohol dehydrogenase family)